MIHGPLYEEAESFKKVPVLDAAAVSRLGAARSGSTS